MLHLQVAALERLNTSSRTVKIRHTALIEQRLRQRPQVSPRICTIRRGDLGICRVRRLITDTAHLGMVPNPLNCLHRHRHRTEHSGNTHRQLTCTTLPPSKHRLRRSRHRQPQMRLNRLMRRPRRILKTINRLRPGRERNRDEVQALAGGNTLQLFQGEPRFILPAGVL